MMDMYEEFNSSVASELSLKEFKSRKVTKNYCFNLPDIPAQSDYLEVRYSVSFVLICYQKKLFSYLFTCNNRIILLYPLSVKSF